MEQKVEYLLQQQQAGAVVITIMIYAGQATFNVIGRPSTQVLLQALDVVRDDILVAVARQEAQQGEAGQDMPVKKENFKDPGEPVGPQTGDTIANGDMTP